MKKKKLPKSIRKYIRQEKARIHREVLNQEQQEKEIEKLFKNLPQKIDKLPKTE
jgi:hypothetical protein